MEAERSSLKRKPLSDCTNTIAAHAAAVRLKPSLRSAVNLPLRSSSANNNEAPTGSLKSNTSTGSNNPPFSTSVYSTLLPASHEIEKQEAKKRKDKGKAVVEDNTVLQPEPPAPLTMKLSSATASDESEKQEAKKRKDKGKAVVEDTTVLQPEPPTPLIRKLSSATAPGTVFPDSFKCKTIYTRKRFPEARHLKSLKITEPFSCPPVNRLKDKGKQVDDGVGDGKSRMRKDLFPAHKKQNRRAKPKREEAVDAMPKEEVEKLRAYYADIDAFELEVEKALDNDLGTNRPR